MPPTHHTPHRPAEADLAERETHGMHAGHPLVVDACSLLDHRTRESLIDPENAPAGRYLMLETGDRRRLLALQRPIIHLGRGLVANVRFEDAHVSRRHAIIALRGEGVRILDDRSLHGTFVNGRPVTVAQLRDGDVIRLGRAVLRYVEIAHAQRATPDPAAVHPAAPRRVALSSVRRRRVESHTPARRSVVG